MTNNKNNEGPIDVNGDITPISKQPVDQVDSSEWENLNVSQLWDQRLILQNRMSMLQQYSSPEVSNQIQMGISRLDSIIATKHNDSGEINLI